MDETSSLWIQPLLLMPGVALLIASTSARFAETHSEVHHVLAGGDERTLDHLIVRAAYLRTALVMLYASCALLSLTVLLVGVFDHGAARWWIGTVGLGGTVVMVMAAALALVRESGSLMTVLRSHRMGAPAHRHE